MTCSRASRFLVDQILSSRTVRSVSRDAAPYSFHSNGIRQSSAATGHRASRPAGDEPVLDIEAPLGRGPMQSKPVFQCEKT